ncbi:MAG TPA: dTDP-4-dehydrorhamnose 3,5-epimerase family protein [Steroidobacteraceae bacterium]|nr:dTDP-4-dehydrorhamnose 3,5-epimerase family protein [Steroidobacteraceae bacterium]
MRFEPLDIPGAALVRIDRKPDERGFFARTWCSQEFAAAGLSAAVVQASISYNEHRGTVRGMHFQWPPSREDKLVRCVRGSLLDVLLDLRPDSPMYLRHLEIPLDDESRDAVFIPHGIAHGFQTLSDRTEVLYQMSDYFAPELGTGFRWNDPRFAIRWPLPVSMISDRDAQCADFDVTAFERELARRQQNSPP